MWHVYVNSYFSPALVEAVGDLSDVAHDLAKQAERDAEPFVPAKTGRMNSMTRVSGSVITYQGSGKQAFWLFRGKTRQGSYRTVFEEGKLLVDDRIHFTKTIHPKAQAHWFWGAKNENAEKWREFSTNEILKKIGGRR
ncbi:MAG: hypothetical protein IJV43_05755 [Oscillospiraceae bacterium]|nr:hypothetical protein [Oscillospiraceae bacterium]MBQ9720267.1 hypothetical protein [Oscillospiraceae bacterium]